VTQHFDQALVIGYIGFSAVGEKWKAQRINSKMSFNTISTFVKAEAFGLDIRIAGILYRLGIDH
jgi:hypothetical protein